MIKPILEPEFVPAIKELERFNQEVAKYPNKQHVVVAVERDNGYVYRREFDVLPDGVNDEWNTFIIERMVKCFLWLVGGYKIYLSGSHKVYENIKSYYRVGGLREFDYNFMSTVYETEVQVIELPENEMPKEKGCSLKIGGNLDGKRIGFDAGGSDRKVSAVVNGEVVYSEETVWFPKQQTDINYHYEEIYTAFKTAAEKMGGDVDAIGISTAGVIIDSRPMVSSLFIKVPKEDFEKVKYVYINCAKRLEKELGHEIPLIVANDGDVTALAGMLDLKDNSVLGIAMGTSEAVGYVNAKGGLNGWLSELAFVPVDFNKQAEVDEWSGDFGVGCKYFSQDAVIKLAPRAGIKLDESLSLAEKLKQVQQLLEDGHAGAKQIFESIGVYLGHSIAFYSYFYDIKNLIILGRVTSGKGGDIILEVAKQVVKEEYPQFANINIVMPSEYMRRVGQSIAAASLPKTNK